MEISSVSCGGRNGKRPLSRSRHREKDSDDEATKSHDELEIHFRILISGTKAPSSLPDDTLIPGKPSEESRRAEQANGVFTRIRLAVQLFAATAPFEFSSLFFPFFSLFLLSPFYHVVFTLALFILSLEEATMAADEGAEKRYRGKRISHVGRFHLHVASPLISEAR